jgi:hypothetical protein
MASGGTKHLLIDENEFIGGPGLYDKNMSSFYDTLHKYMRPTYFTEDQTPLIQVYIPNNFDSMKPSNFSTRNETFEANITVSNNNFTDIRIH